MSQQPRLAVESIPGKRPYQEDSVFADVLGDGRTLLAVADGMGGHAAGEVASALALKTLQDALSAGRSLGDAFRLANERVHNMATEPGKQGMGTTMVAVLIAGTEFEVANVGDSRAYLVNGEGIHQLTDDHSFVAEAMRRGQTREQAMATPWRDALTRSIGTEPEVEVDVFGPFPLKSDAALVICSDGLYKTLSNEELCELFMKSGGPRGAAQAMVTAAFDEGSDDNISVVIAEYGNVPRGKPSLAKVLSYDQQVASSAEEEKTKPTLPVVRVAARASAKAEEGDSTELPVAAIVAIAVVVVVLATILLATG